MGLISENFLNDPLAGPLRPQDKMLEKKEDEDFGFFDYAGDLALSIPRGIAGAVEGIGEIGNIIPGVNYDIPTNLGLGHSETFAGGAIEGISEFAVGFVPVLGWVGRGAKVGKGMKLAGGLEKAAQAPGAKGFLARRGQEAVAGGITDFMVIQGHEARLSDLIQQFPGLQNPITEFLQSDEEDSEIVGRLKAAVEGIGAGVIFDSMLLGMRALKSGRKAFDDGVAKGLEPEEAAKDAVTEMDRVAAETADEVVDTSSKPAEVLETPGVEPPKTPATRAAGEPDEPEGLPEGDLRSTLEAREGLREEDIIDVETGKLNLRGIEGELKPTIRAVQEVLDDRVDEAVRTSDDDVLLDNLETVASFTGESAETIAKRLGADAASTREVNKRVLAYKWIVEAQTQDKLKPALDAVQKALDEDGAVSDELILKASQALTETQGIVQELAGLRTAQSQGLRIFKESEPFMALTKDPDVDAAIRQSRKDILEELGGREEVLKKLRAIRDILENGGGTAAAMEALKKQRNNKWLLAFNEGFINNILGGIKTLTTNFMGPMIVSAYRPMETALGGLVTGNTKVVQRSFRELMGLMTGWRDVAQGARMSILKDEIVFDPSARQVDLPANQRRAISAQGLDIKSQGVGSMVNAIGSVIGMPSRLLGGTDNFVKQLNYRAVVRADLIEQGLERGLRGKDLAEWVEKSMDSMVINGAALTARNLDREANRRGLSGIKKVNWIKSKLADGDIQDRQALATRALEVSREVTFTRQLKEDESVFRSVSQSAQKIVNQHPILRPFVPFIRTPANLLSFAGERTADPVMTMVRTLNPLSRTTPKQFSALHGNRSRMMADLASQDPQRKSEAYGRVIAGFGFTATGVMFASTGNLTGGGPKNYKERKLLEEGGWRPYSIKVGDNYFSYQRMDPFASMLGIFADMADIARYAPPEMQEEVESLGLNLGIAVARNIGSKTYLQGVMDLAGLLENPERFVGETARGFAGAMIPNYLGQSVQAVSGDESMREVRTWMDAMQAKIPFLSEGLDPQRNFMGEPMERYMALGGRWTDWFLPIVHSTTSSDPINREIAQLGHAFAPPSAHRYDMDLRTVTKSSGQSAYDRWMELHQEVRIGGRSLNQAMNRLLRSANYRRMSPDGLGDEESPRILEIRKLVQQYRVKAEQQLFREFPDIHQARKNKMITRRGLRTGRTKESIRSSLFPLD